MTSRVLIVVLCMLGMLIIIGCESVDEGNEIAGSDDELVAIVEAPQTNDQSLTISKLKEDIEELNQRIQQYEAHEIGPHTYSDRDIYAHVSVLKSKQNWDEIIVFNNESSVTITDREIVDFLSEFFVIEGQTDFPNGAPYNLEPFSVQLIKGDMSYTIDVISRGIIYFADVASGYITMPYGISELGNAFLPKPDYFPEETLENRLLNSKLGSIKLVDYPLYYVFESRLRSITIAFLLGDKKIIDQPDIELSEFIYKVTYLLYGEEITMTVYSSYIVIEEHDDATWYKVSEDLAQQIGANIRAG